MTIEEAIKDIQEDGIDLGAGDYVDVEALKIAVEVMKDYQRVVYENEQLRQKQKGEQMRDKNRLYKFYDELREIHMTHFPDWRFGQMIINVLADWQTKTGRDIFFPEDDEMIQIFRDYVER